jgi:GNAT superfamily N-acetyltransferase
MIQYRPLVDSDLDEMVEIKKQAYLKSWITGDHAITADEILHLDWTEHKKDMETLLSIRRMVSQAAVCDGCLVGFGILIPVSEGYLVRNMFVHPDYQDQGIGSHIMNYLIHQAPLGETVWLSTSRASKFYHKFGFKECGFDANGTQKMSLVRPK